MSAISPLKELLDLDELGKSLKEKRCVLMLGPRIATVMEAGKEVPLMEGLSMQFARMLDDQNLPYERLSSHNLCYISQLLLREKNIARDDLRKKAKIYFEEKTNQYIPPIYLELAALPVRVIVNTTPDDYIVRALQQAGKQPHVFNFNYEINAGSERGERTFRQADVIGVMQPLVVNLFGTTQDMNSLVITESDQVAFISSILKGESQIPKEILNFFQPQNTYLLFGFNLENWQFRLLLKFLKLNEQNQTLSPQTNNYPVTEVTKSFLRHEFNFHFVDIQMEDFAREIGSLVRTFDTESVFLSYADEDAEELQLLLKALKPLRLTNPKLQIWHRGLITDGNVEEQVAGHLEKANIIMPLLSADYLSDDYVLEKEMPVIQRHYREGKAEVVPVILKSCIWREIPFFQKLMVLPADESPVTGTNQDEAFRSVAAAFKRRFL